MPDLGERGNVMGPQPIAAIVEPPAEMFAAAEHLLKALMRGDLASVEDTTGKRSSWSDIPDLAAAVAQARAENGNA